MEEEVAAMVDRLFLLSEDQLRSSMKGREIRFRADKATVAA